MGLYLFRPEKVLGQDRNPTPVSEELQIRDYDNAKEDYGCITVVHGVAYPTHQT